VAAVNAVWLPPHLETDTSWLALALGALTALAYLWWRWR